MENMEHFTNLNIIFIQGPRYSSPCCSNFSIYAAETITRVFFHIIILNTQSYWFIFLFFAKHCFNVCLVISETQRNFVLKKNNFQLRIIEILAY